MRARASSVLRSMDCRSGHGATRFGHMHSSWRPSRPDARSSSSSRERTRRSRATQPRPVSGATARQRCHSAGPSVDAGLRAEETYGMRPAVLALALLPLAAPVALPQQAVDTTVTLQGFLQHDAEVHVWTIVVPLPI